VSIDILLLAWQILILQFQKKIWVALNCFLWQWQLIKLFFYSAVFDLKRDSLSS
jgi:hypothetical protein